MARMSITFDGFEKLAAEVDRVSGQLHEAVDEALEGTFKMVQSETTSASAIYATKGGGRKGYATGKMFAAIKSDDGVQWKGSVAEVGVGFDFEKKGGYHSVFIMYGTPRIAKDSKVYNAIKGTKIRKRVYEEQEKVMKSYLAIGGGKK